LRYARNYRPQVWSATICTILNKLCDLTPSYLIGLAVDVVVEQENSLIARFGITSIIGQLGILSVLTLVVWSLESMFEFLYDRQWRNLAQTLQHELRLDVQTGRILIDSIDIRELNLFDLRQCIGWVSQDVFLFHGTVAENIRYGSFDATLEQIIQAAKLAEAHAFIEQLPQGYDTIVGERGQKLSGGQRQRLAIARAILKDPPILILDEATSAVDNETEAAIQKSLAKITQNRTTIAVAHRLSTIRHAHCIYVMDQGQLVEQGTHEELLVLNGIYANLWSVQSGLLPTLC
jgi:ABC-type multidrug transport system fused ATPase/permease subunit